ARKVAAAADAVHDAAAGDVRGVDVAVDVGLDHAVHGDAAEPADDLGMIGDFLRPEQDALTVEIDVAAEFLDAVGTERKRGRRGHAQHAIAKKPQHAVLDHLGVRGEIPVTAFSEAREYGVGDVADA